MISLKKRGISPVVATVLLIVIVIILALIIFLWAKGFVKESIMKEGENVKFVCEDVSLELSYSDNILRISNNGNVPVYRVELKGKKGGSIKNINIPEDKNTGIRIGKSWELSLSESYEEIYVYPVILGKLGNREKPYTCKNKFVVENI